MVARTADPEKSGRVTAPITDEMREVLTPAALEFVSELVRSFRPRVDELLARRKEAQARRDQGEALDFLDETKHVREGDWRVAKLPDELLDRRVEITGPVDAKMIINALNSGAQVFMADFEDSLAPTWENVVLGQKHLMAAVRGTLSKEDAARGKRYTLNDERALLMVRPRGWHLEEKHFVVGHSLVDERRAPASLFDFGLCFFHNAREQVRRGTRPYFYLPKLESHLEARLWNDVFVHAQQALGIKPGTVKATVLIETLPAAFEMDEILFELKEHAAGLNCGRWDYIFSFIKCHRNDADSVLPDRGQVGMTQPNMRAYTQLVVKTCHRRGASAVGGMAAQIPIKSDAAANEAALAKVRADKEREVKDGHDGTWVAHPGLVALARESFEQVLAGKPNQLDVLRDDVQVRAEDLLRVPEGTRSEQGLRENVRIGVQYLEAWLGGNGCVPLSSLMEDAATAEISRTQVWQWLKHEARLDDGREVTRELFDRVVADEMARIRMDVGDERFEAGAYEAAKQLFVRLSTADECEEFLTLSAYEQI